MADAKDGLAARRLDLDCIRIGAFALLIGYHVGMYYVPWDWHVKSAVRYPWLEPVMALTNPWRLTLLFVVSGAASRFMLDKLGARRFARVRAARLFAPLLFGMVVVVPPQTWLQVAQMSGGRAMPFGAFYARYITASGGWSANGVPLVTPTWNHLWFVPYMLVYTLVLAFVCALWRGLPQAATATASRMLVAGGGAAPAAWFVFVRLVLYPRFPETHALFGDWTVHAQSAAAFLLGFAMAKAPAAWSALERQRRTLAVAAVLSNLAYAGTLALWIAGSTSEKVSSPVMAWSFGLDQWLTVAAILAYASAHLRRVDHPVRLYLTEAIFPFYIVHQTVIIAAASALRPWALPPALEAPLIVLATVAGCVLTFETVRRVRVLRPLFGLGPVRSGSEPRPPSPVGAGR